MNENNHKHGDPSQLPPEDQVPSDDVPVQDEPPHDGDAPDDENVPIDPTTRDYSYYRRIREQFKKDDSPEDSMTTDGDDMGDDDSPDDEDTTTSRQSPIAPSHKPSIVNNISPKPAPDAESGLTDDEEQDENLTIPKKAPTDRQLDTAVLSNLNYKRKPPTGPLNASSVNFGDKREIILVVRGMVERVVLEDDKPVKLGRTDQKSRFIPDVDLTPYGAIDRGVSREHAQLEIADEKLYVTDLDSTNGTFLAGQRLEPGVKTVIRKGDELLLGRLAVQVLFR